MICPHHPAPLVLSGPLLLGFRPLAPFLLVHHHANATAYFRVPGRCIADGFFREPFVHRRGQADRNNGGIRDFSHLVGNPVFSTQKEAMHDSCQNPPV